jgi:hypothetical protein
MAETKIQRDLQPRKAGSGRAYKGYHTEAKRKALEAIATKPASGNANSDTEKVAS